ncbi:MAG: cyclic nucleotide-binding domain-containing protein, partial [Deltaproteobacteria bacterium]|nr:cyclic nucleotide-binding domain-containing protein [Deltaproteobacteria bacterium]
MSPQEKKTTGASKKPAAAGGRSRKAAGSAPARQSEEANGVNNEILSTLCSIPFFSSLADDEKNLQVLASFMSKEKVPAATVVVREGEVGDKLYILYRGEVEVIRRTLDNEEYKV